MKIKRINTAFLLFALAGIVLTGCSNEDIVNVNPQEKGTGNVSFSIVEKDYEPADNTPKSRAAIEETKPEIQDLGNGLMAEVSLVPDTTHRAETPKTRAIATPTHYTIQAFQGGVKKGELKGTFNGSTFTPDAGQPKSISLPHGTYDFVCFNDGVTSNGTQLTVNRTDAGTARFDVQRNVQINQDPKQQVKFTMKHAGAAVHFLAIYMNFDLLCKTTSTLTTNKRTGAPSYKGVYVIPSDQFKYLIETPANAIPATMVYDIAADSYTYTKGQSSTPGEADAGMVEAAYSSPNDIYNITFCELLSDYWLPTTDCSKFRVKFTSGAPYGCSLSGKSITLPTTHKQLEANKRYIMVIRFYITDQYLYNDGTVGPRDKNLTKTPVGVVSAMSRGMYNGITATAIALHDVTVGGSDQIQWHNVTTQETSTPRTSYSNLFEGYPAQYYSPNPAMQSANNYMPPFGIYHWTIADFIIFNRMGVCLGKMVDSYEEYKQYRLNRSLSYILPSGTAATGFSTPAPSSIVFPSLDMTRFNQAFTKVGGTPPSGTYWTATECQDGTEYKQATVTITGNKFHLDLKPKTSTAKIRPFMSINGATLSL